MTNRSVVDVCEPLLVGDDVGTSLVIVPVRSGDEPSKRLKMKLFDMLRMLQSQCLHRGGLC